VSYYDRNADTLSERYLALAPDDVHATWAESVLAGKTPGLACDIGAGSGRDANWLAEKGWEVIAVEPSRGMRERGRQRSHPRVSWLDDRLPGLKRLRSLGHRFDLILVSAVWMHLAPGTRERAFRVLSDCLRPGGTLVITLRHGNDEVENRERGFHVVSGNELLAFACARALVLEHRARVTDSTRPDVAWETLVFASAAPSS
jgi:SAM-dependent methyltransferase